MSYSSQQRQQQTIITPQRNQQQYSNSRNNNNNGARGNSNSNNYHYDDDEDFNNQHSPADTTGVRSDAALRHDVLKILLATQKTEAENRSKMLERKTLLTLYCSTLLKWMEFTMMKVNAKERKKLEEKEKSFNEEKTKAVAAAVQDHEEKIMKKNQQLASAKAPPQIETKDDDDDDGEAAVQTPKNNKLRNLQQPEFHGVVRVGPPSPGNSSKTAQKGENISNGNNFVAIPHATLHTLRRQWQKRVAALLERRSFFIIQQRCLNKWKIFSANMKGNQEAYRALSSSESAQAVARRRRRQVVLNSIEMQKARALRAVGLRALFKWRIFATMKQGSEKKLSLMEKEAQAAAIILAERQLRQREEQDRLTNTAPESLQNLVSGLQKRNEDFPQNNNNTTTTATAIRPTFFATNDDSSLDYASPRSRNPASDIIIAKSFKSLKSQISRLKFDMTKIKDDVRQANYYIATECTQWNLHYQKKFGTLNKNTNDFFNEGENANHNNSKNNGGAVAPPPPSWQYEKSILQRRAAAYDALLEDHRMLQESLKAAEDDIARLRSIAVLREMHSPPSNMAVSNNNNNIQQGDNTLGLTNTPRIALQPYYHPLAPNSIGRTSRSGSSMLMMNNNNNNNNINNNDFNVSSSYNDSNAAVPASTTTTTRNTSASNRFNATAGNNNYYNNQEQGNERMTSPGGAQVQPRQIGVNSYVL